MFKTKKVLFLFMALLIPIFQVSAQTLENIPGQTSVGESDLLGYLNNLYKFGISITGILAIFMIGLGAFAYIVTSAGNSSKMMDAKETINNALIGLVIALTAYLFLYVINPDLVGQTLETPQNTLNTVMTGSPSLSDGMSCRTNAPGGPGGGGVINPNSPSCSDCENGSYVAQNGGTWVAYCGSSGGSSGGGASTQPATADYEVACNYNGSCPGCAIVCETGCINGYQNIGGGQYSCLGSSTSAPGA